MANIWQEADWFDLLDNSDHDHDLVSEPDHASPADLSQEVQGRRDDMPFNMGPWARTGDGRIGPEALHNNPPRADHHLHHLHRHIIPDSEVGDDTSSPISVLDSESPEPTQQSPGDAASGTPSIHTADFDSSQEVDQNEDDVSEPWDLGSDEAAALFLEGGSPPSSLGDDEGSQNRGNRQHRARQPNPAANNDDDLFVSDHSPDISHDDDDDDDDDGFGLSIIDAPLPGGHDVFGEVEEVEQELDREIGRLRDSLPGEVGRGGRMRQRIGAHGIPNDYDDYDDYDDDDDDDDSESLERIFQRRNGRRNLRERDYSPRFLSGVRYGRRRSASPSRHGGVNVRHAPPGAHSHHLNRHGDRNGLAVGSEVRRGPRIGIDELIDIEFDGFLGQNNSPPLLPRLLRNNTGRNHNNNNRNNNNPNRHNMANNDQPVEVIDLTDDSPPALRPPRMDLPPAPGLPRNPRRVGPRNPSNPPSLARSDGSALGAANAARASFIDLTEDDDADNVGPPPARDDGDLQFIGGRVRPDVQPRRREPAAAARPPVMPLGLAAGHLRDALQQHFNNLPNLPNFFGFNFGNNLHQPPNMNANQNPLGPNGPPNLNYGIAAFANNNANPNKPAYREPSPVSEGFTRNTGAAGFEEDEICVCPGCDEELAYDPDSDGEDQPPPAKKSRTGSARKPKKSDRHHFWALKDCGHVYCSTCYNNRTKGSKGWDQTIFRLPNGEVADGTMWKEVDRSVVNNNNGRKVLCAVENCPTDVKPASAWVGIFM